MDSLFLILLLVSLICLFIGLFKPSVIKLPSRKRASIVFGCTTILFFILFGIASPKTETATKKPVAKEDMNLNIRETTMQEASGYSSMQPVIAIKNLNSFDWKECTFTLNGEYTATLPFIDIPSELRTSATDTHDSMIITERHFAKEDGTLFNDMTQVPLKIEVICNSPYLGEWYGSFR